MDVLSKQAKIGSLNGLASKMRSPSNSFKMPKINTEMSSRTKMEEDPDYKRKQLTPLTGKLYNPTRAPKMPKI